VFFTLEVVFIVDMCR